MINSGINGEMMIEWDSICDFHGISSMGFNVVIND